LLAAGRLANQRVAYSHCPAARPGVTSRLLRARNRGRIMSMRKNSGPTKVMHRHHIRPLLRSGEGKVK
jgi:hypothetical protein